MSNKKNPPTGATGATAPISYERDIYPGFLVRPQAHGKGAECFCSPITTHVGSVTIFQHRNPREASKEAPKGAISGKNS